MLADLLRNPWRRLKHPFSGHRVRGGLDDADRARFTTAMALARERLDATDVLWAASHKAESLHVLARALAALEDALAIARLAPPEPSLAQALLRMEPDVQALRDARGRLERCEEVDARLDSDDLALAHATRDLARSTHARLRKAMRQPGEVARRRIGVVVALAIVVAALKVIQVALRDDVEVVASDVLHPTYAAVRVVDGDLSTEWLAPEDKDGWLEVRLRKPIDVQAVRITNAHNAPHNDRGAKQLDVHLYHGDTLLAGTQTTFNQIETVHQAREIPIAGARVTKVRCTLRSHHGKGGGLAEIEIVERKR